MSERDDQMKVHFLRVLRETGVVSQAVKASGFSRNRANKLYREDVDFQAAYDEAMEDAMDAAEEELRKRAIDGDEQPVIHQGKLCYHLTYQEDEYGLPVLDDDGNPIPVKREVLTVRKKSDELLKFLLQGRRKQVFSQRTELTGADGEPLEADENARAARIAQILEQAKARSDNSDLA